MSLEVSGELWWDNRGKLIKLELVLELLKEIIKEVAQFLYKSIFVVGGKTPVQIFHKLVNYPVLVKLEPYVEAVFELLSQLAF